MNYEEGYHLKAHNFLISDSSYYNLRARLAFDRYFLNVGIQDNSKVLEYGCGLGQNILFLGNKAVGYDISKFALDFCKKKGIKVIGNKNLIDKFDVIFSAHTFEHLDNPLEDLFFIKSKLSKDGILILVLPREFQKDSSLNPDKRNYHLYSWNFRTINNLLDRAGFEVLQNKVYYGTGFRKLKFLSLFSFGLYDFFIRAIGYLANSSEMMIVARKKKQRD